MKRFLIILSILIFSVQLAYAQCPFNEVNCAYGCWRHHDEDGDGYCDFSILEGSALQANIEAKNKALNEKNEAEEEKVKEKESSINDEKTAIKETETKIDITEERAIEEENSTDTLISEVEEIKPEIVDENNCKNLSGNYNLMSISLITLLLYFATALLVRFKKLKKIYHRRLWNTLLLITFLVSGLLGFILVIQLNYGFATTWIKSFLYWHVQFGISMTIISIIHIVWHLSYFKRIFNKVKN